MKAAKEALDAATADLGSALLDIAVDPGNALALERMRELESVVAAQGVDVAAMKTKVFRTVVARELADEHLTMGQEQRLEGLARALFPAGERKSVEVPYTRLIDLNVYTDAVQFHVSGRANPPILRVANGPMVALVVNVAAQRLG